MERHRLGAGRRRFRRIGLGAAHQRRQALRRRMVHRRRWDAHDERRRMEHDVRELDKPRFRHRHRRARRLRLRPGVRRRTTSCRRVLRRGRRRPGLTRRRLGRRCMDESGLRHRLRRLGQRLGERRRLSLRRRELCRRRRHLCKQHRDVGPRNPRRLRRGAARGLMGGRLRSRHHRFGSWRRFGCDERDAQRDLRVHPEPVLHPDRRPCRRGPGNASRRCTRVFDESGRNVQDKRLRLQDPGLRASQRLRRPDGQRRLRQHGQRHRLRQLLPRPVHDEPLHRQ